jgi:hypothetical protein
MSEAVSKGQPLFFSSAGGIEHLIFFVYIYIVDEETSGNKDGEIYTHVSETDFRKFANPLDELYNDSD